MNAVIYSFLNLSFGGGFEKWIQEVAPRLKTMGHTVTVITTKAGTKRVASEIKEGIRMAGVEIIELDSYPMPLAVPKLNGLKKMLKITKDADIIYFNNAFAGNEMLMTLLRHLNDIPICAGYHGMSPEVASILGRFYHATFNKHFSKFFDCHHVVNKERGALLKSYGYRNVIWIPNGVDTHKFKPNWERKNDRFRVLFVGRLSYQKGIDLLASIIRILNNSPQLKRRIQYVIVGEGKLRSRIKKLGASERNVECLGYLAEKKLLEIYSNSNVLVAPSRNEEFLLTALEAQSAGVPVVVSNVRGPKEIVIHGKTGFLVPVDPVFFVAMIKKILNMWLSRPEEYLEMCKAARENALRYDWDQIVNKIDLMLRRVSDRVGPWRF